MASTTTNIGLTKPAGTDQALISAINGNMDIIDTKMGAVGNTSVQGQITALSDQIENKANGGGVSWGTSFTVKLSKNVGYLFVNHDLRIQIWLTGEGIQISSSYNSGTNVYGFTKSVTGNTITFSGTDPNGNAFTITKNGSTITITKSTSGAMLIVC